MKRSSRIKLALQAAVGSLDALIKAAEARDEKDFTAEEQTQADTLEKQIEKLQKDFESAVRQEKLLADAESVPAVTPTGNAGTVPAQAKDQMAPDQMTALVAAGHIKGKALGVHPLKALEDAGYGRFAEEIAEANGLSKSVNTLTPAAGGILMPQAARGQLLEQLQPRTTFLQLNPVRVPLVGGRYEQPYATSGATAAYVGEGQKKPVSDVAFDKFDLKAKKLAGIVLITKEAKRWLIPEIEAYVRRQLNIALPQAMDTAAYLGTGTGDSPLGILNRPGIGIIDGAAAGRFADPTAPTLQELDRLAAEAMLYMSTRDMPMGNPMWLMHPTTVAYLRDIRVGDGTGVFAFPEMQGTAPRWKGFPVLVTNKVPANLGAGTDETLIALIDGDEVLFAEEEGFTVNTSEEATIDVQGTLVHLFQQNMMAVLAEMMHDFGLQRPAGVVRINGIRWGR